MYLSRIWSFLKREDCSRSISLAYTLPLSGRLKGKGNVLTFENVGRRINNDEFVDLVAGASVSTSIEWSATLGPLIRPVLALRNTVTFAVTHIVA